MVITVKTVRELIEALKQFPEDSVPVGIEQEEWGICIYADPSKPLAGDNCLGFINTPFPRQDAK